MVHESATRGKGPLLQISTCYNFDRNKGVYMFFQNRGRVYANDFLEFVREQGVIGLAIGFVIGAAATTLVRSLIDNVVMPPVGILLGSAEGIKGLSINLGTYNGKVAELTYGIFLNDLINFLILAFVVYMVVHVMRLDRIDKKK